jgi:UDP-N-acetylmuramate dehydrogenase
MNFEELQKKLPGLKENISLKHYTTFKIGGPAKFFYVAKTKKDLVKAAKLAKELNIPFFVLGGGSKILVSDKGFDGLVIKTENDRIFSERVDQGIVRAEAGARLVKLIGFCLENSLTGLEWAAGIPGTIGGAVRGNSGAFGHSTSEVVAEVEIFDPQTLEIKTLSNKDCCFAYRDSIFKKNKHWVIISTTFKLNQGNKEAISEKIKEYLNIRRQKHSSLPSAGCVFKNPKPQAAGLLIDQCGLKAKKIGQAQISEQHANFIVNLGQAKAEDVLALIKLAKQEVKNKFGVELEEEIQLLGF